MVYREEIAVDKGIDNTLSLLKEGYKYISNRTKKYNRSMFETRLLGGKQFICMIGEDAAKVFYDEEKFKRHGAAPKRVLKTLFGKKGVQTLDGRSHHNRKELFMSIMTTECLKEMSEIVETQWRKEAKRWGQEDSIVLYDEVKKVLTRSACIWAGVPLLEEEVNKMANKLSAMFEAGGAVGPRHIRGQLDRNYLEGWAKKLISSVREGLIQVNVETPLYKIAFHEDLNGELLPIHTASVELMNILRPIVAISVYIAFCALALHHFPEEKKKLKQADKKAYIRFVQEVRRYYPFFPVTIAQVREDFIWNGHHFKKDTHVLLDLYGTNHHEDLWELPDSFNPDRFINWSGNPFSFIPQGGGDFHKGHRCAGEWLTVEVMTKVIELMVNQMEYTTPKQNLNYSLVKMPSMPENGFIMSDIQITE